MDVYKRPIRTCTNCLKETRNHNGFWYLNDHYGMTGDFCADCYTLVSHDAYGNPVHPQEYVMILLKRENSNGKKTKN